MIFTTPVELPAGTMEISHRSRLLLIGSCFADNIGRMLQRNKFNIDTNPFGVQYNPMSIATVLTRIADGDLFTSGSPELFEHNGKWHSLLHHSDFSRDSKEELLATINDRLAKAHKAVRELDTVIVTFGTAYVYTRTDDGLVVGNCHKLPGNMFSRSLLSIEQITESAAAVMRHYIADNPKVKFMFTVSPIRHLRDGAHDNQLSKSTLLLAIEKLLRMFPGNACYFPSYEIMMDELRDYRYYADDMLHPSAKAVEYIWECFAKCHFSKETQALCRRTADVARALEHRPFDAASPGYRTFVEQTLDKIGSIAKEHPYIDFENEIRQCNTLLNR